MPYKNKKDQASASKRHYEANKEKIKERTKIRRKTQKQKNKDYVKAYKSLSKCVDCGENNPLVLDFDHVRGKKVKCISDMMRGGYCLDSLKKEIAKCEIRCANCHRIVTYNRIK